MAWLSRVAEPGEAEIHRLVRARGAAEAARRIRSGEVSPTLDRATQARRGIDRAEADLAEAGCLGIRLVTPTDGEWPGAALQPLEVAAAGGSPHSAVALVPPVALWVKGEHRLDEVLGQSIAIIGARASTPYGEHVAAELAFGMAERGWTVVSGGAYGIDAAAHRGALAVGGRTAAFLACGLDVPYPTGNAPLFEQIAAAGLLISEWPIGTRPQRHRFLIRNRLIAAVAAGTVIVEAAARSGTSATARQVVRLGRSLMAVPGPVTSAMSVGTNELVRSLDARLVTRVEEVVEEVGAIGADLAQPREIEQDARDMLDTTASRVLDGVPLRGGATPEEVAVASGIPVGEVLRALPRLEIAGLIEACRRGWRLAPRRRARRHDATQAIAGTPGR